MRESRMWGSRPVKWGIAALIVCLLAGVTTSCSTSGGSRYSGGRSRPESRAIEMQAGKDAAALRELIGLSNTEEWQTRLVFGGMYERLHSLARGYQSARHFDMEQCTYAINNIRAQVREQIKMGLNEEQMAAYLKTEEPNTDAMLEFLITTIVQTPTSRPSSGGRPGGGMGRGGGMGGGGMGGGRPF